MTNYYENHHPDPKFLYEAVTEAKTHLKGLSVALEKLTIGQVEEHLSTVAFVEEVRRVAETLGVLEDVASAGGRA
jgi:pterin-4a-carbinolamine dehydratase|tara:strand:- start:79 stop:303 length:225 start_codon:yes stop_codon:yes gene_type:complete